MRIKVDRKYGRQQTRPKKKWLPVVLLVAGVLLIGASLAAYMGGEPATSAAPDYEPGDVATDKPLYAVHEMGEGPPIPFLAKNQPQPAVVVPERFYDFGRISPGDVVEKTFIIRNTGGAPLTISRAYTTCGCTTAEISASVIPPGKVATIKLLFDAGFHDTAGQTVRRGLIIENNDRNYSQAEIWIQASVRAN